MHGRGHHEQQYDAAARRRGQAFGLLGGRRPPPWSARRTWRRPTPAASRPLAEVDAGPIEIGRRRQHGHPVPDRRPGGPGPGSRPCRCRRRARRPPGPGCRNGSGTSGGGLVLATVHLGHHESFAAELDAGGTGRAGRPPRTTGRPGRRRRGRSRSRAPVRGHGPPTGWPAARPGGHRAGPPAPAWRSRAWPARRSRRRSTAWARSRPASARPSPIAGAPVDQW